VAEEIVFPRRSFRDVHQLVFLFQSWQLMLEEADLPAALQPLREVPDDLVPVIARALRSARDQLETAQAGSEIALRFAATPEFATLLEWGSAKLREVAELIEHDSLDPVWANAMRLARDLVDSAVAQIGAPEPLP
jgi:hypothetical protein